MSIEAHRCNQEGCNGFVVFDNADFDFKNIPTNKEVGCYSFDEPTCNVCGKEFLVIPYYMVVEIKDKDFGEYEELESCCMTEVEKQKR
jgi:hypothetical protein